MIPLFSANQIRKIDEFAIRQLGIPGNMLMENASREIFKAINSHVENSSIKPKIAFVCGRGNNGGDGFAAARHFVNAGYTILVVYLGTEKEMSSDCRLNFTILKKISSQSVNLKIVKYKNNSSLKPLSKYSIVCDALLGTGIKGSIKEPYSSIVNYLNRLKAFKVAVDIPTGLNSDTGFADHAFNADLTITLGELKKGLFFEDGYVHSGEVVKGNIGIPTSLFNKYIPTEYLIEPEDALSGLPIKKKSIHKYSAGKVLTIAGSGSLPGAAVLTAKSVLKIGAGASILYFPKSVRNLIHKKLGEVVVHSYDDENKEYVRAKNLNDLRGEIKWADVIAVGPGLGREKETQQAVIKILEQRKNKKVVIDADGVFALGKNRYKKLNLKNCIFTPHKGEFANLIGVSSNELRRDVLKYGRSFVKRTGTFLVLKGAPTIIFTPKGEALINTVGNPSLAKFGTGDVLTGFIAGMLSQQNNIEKSIVTAVYLHSLASDLLAFRNSEYTLLASDIIKYLPPAIKFLRKSVV
jgi:NAD(P)H-hydrate epimerase